MDRQHQTPTLDGAARELDLYDSTIQALYGIGLKLDYCIELVDIAPDQVKLGLEGVVTNLDSLIEALRNRIYELHWPCHGRTSHERR